MGATSQPQMFLKLIMEVEEGWWEAILAVKCLEVIVHSLSMKSWIAGIVASIQARSACSLDDLRHQLGFHFLQHKDLPICNQQTYKTQNKKL